MLTQKKNYITVPQLKKRGWTDSMIRDHLGSCDSTRPNPHYTSAAPMRLYLMERVEAVEQSEAWAALQEKSQRRQQGAEKAVQTKRMKLLAALETLQIAVPQIPEHELKKQACKHYNQRKEEWDDWIYDTGRTPEKWTRATIQSDPAFLQRITVNYLRHALTHYEDELEKIAGKVGVRDAYIEINRKCYTAIADTYPYLADECTRQLDDKIELHQMAQEHDGTETPRDTETTHNADKPPTTDE